MPHFSVFRQLRSVGRICRANLSRVSGRDAVWAGLVVAVATIGAGYSFHAIEPSPQTLKPTAARETSLEELLEMLRRRREFLDSQVKVDDDPEVFAARHDLCIVLDAVNAVAERVHPFNYGYLCENQLPLPRSRSEVVAQGAGICGNQVDVFLQLVRELGFEARSVQLYGMLPDGSRWSHIGAEVKVAGKFRLFDVTYAQAFVRKPPGAATAVLDDALSFDEAIALSPDELEIYENRVGWKNVICRNGEAHDFGSYVRGEISAAAIVGVSGTIQALHFTEEGALRNYTSDGIPAFIGSTDDHGAPPLAGRGVELELRDLRGADRVELDVIALVCSDGERSRLTLCDAATGRLLDTQPPPKGKNRNGTVVFTIPKEYARELKHLRLTLESGLDSAASDHRCFALWKELRVWQHASPQVSQQPATTAVRRVRRDAPAGRR